MNIAPPSPTPPAPRGNLAHFTLIALLRHAFQTWRRREGWSRQTLALRVQAVHESLGMDRVTGFSFAPADSMPAEYARLAAARLYWWLDDDSKDDDLLPPNLLPTLIATLPLDLRLPVADALLAPAGLRVETASAGDELLCLSHLLRRVVRENASAEAAVANAIDNPGVLPTALTVIRNGIATLQDAAASIEARLAETRPGRPG